MAYFLAKLIPPRGRFIQEMTADEAKAMRAHADYWLPHLSAGLILAMGPVADPAGDWGVALCNAPSQRWLEDMQADDPALTIGCRYENLSMPSLKVAPLEPLAPVDTISP